MKNIIILLPILLIAILISCSWERTLWDGYQVPKIVSLSTEANKLKWSIAEDDSVDGYFIYAAYDENYWEYDSYNRVGKNIGIDDTVFSPDDNGVFDYYRWFTVSSYIIIDADTLEGSRYYPPIARPRP